MGRALRAGDGGWRLGGYEDVQKSVLEDWGWKVEWVKEGDTEAGEKTLEQILKNVC